MPRKIINIDLDFFKSNSFCQFAVKKFDSIILNINARYDGQDYEVKGACKLYVSYEKSDGIFEQTENIEINGNNIEIKLNENLLSTLGMVYAEIELLDINGKITSSSIIFKIDDKISVGVPVPEVTETFVDKCERLINEYKTELNNSILNLSSDVNAQFNTIEQKKADKEELDIERKRLDNIVANNNNTEGNSELVDIRIGTDGTNYTCAGEAVREQFSNNNSKIQESASKNTEQDTRLINIEHKNKVQDVYLNGLFNENSDGRLSINGEGNDLKLEGSKAGLATVDSVVGSSLVNCVGQVNNITLFQDKGDTYYVNRKDNTISKPKIEYKNSIAQVNKTYTLIFNILKNTLTREGSTSIAKFNIVSYNIGTYPITSGVTGLVCVKLTQPEIITGNGQPYFEIVAECIGEFEMTKPILLEGDYTNKPIPQQVFTGIQSSFEGNKVTQEMVDGGTELTSNLGKYKVTAKVVGKNLFDGKWEKGNLNGENGLPMQGDSVYRSVNYLDVNGCTQIIHNYALNIYNYSEDKGYLGREIIQANVKYTLPPGTKYIKLYRSTQHDDLIIESVNESQVTTTPYEPYFESTHNVYLNSPLLKGDVLEDRNDGVYHVHNIGRRILDGNSTILTYGELTNNTIGFNIKYVSDFKPLGNVISNTFKTLTLSDNIFSNDVEGISLTQTTFGIRILKSKLTTPDVAGFKAWLQANPVTVIYELAEPFDEKISDNKFLCEIPNNATLHLDSNIPATSVKATYTSNVVSVVKLDKIQYQQDQVNIDNAYRLTVLETSNGLTI